MTANPDAFCCRCHSDFPVEGESFRMGFMRPLAKAPTWMRRQFASWKGHPDGAYLCGSCYFDLLDEADA